MVTTDHAAAIRAELKQKHGWNSRHVSVKSDYYSMGSSIRVTIKDARIHLSDVEAIANAHESIHRDEATGEILSGGNRYVDVNYSSEAMTERSKRYLPAIKTAAELRESAGDSSLIPIEGTKYLLGMSPYGRFSLWSDSFLCESYSQEGLARELAVRIRQ